MSLCFFFSSRRRHTRFKCDWSSDVCSSDLHDGVGEMLMAPEWHGIIWQSLATIGGVLLLIGFFTPMAGMLVVIVELWTALSRADNLRTCIVLAVVGAALAMLGPGIWSIDARLFGRKRIDIGDR